VHIPHARNESAHIEDTVEETVKPMLADANACRGQSTGVVLRFVAARI
jgi:hypothetical protein